MPNVACDEAYWRNPRRHFKLGDLPRFFNKGAADPTSNLVLKAHESVDHQIAMDSSDPFLTRLIEDVRQQLASFVHADELFFTYSTTEGMNIFAHGIDWKPGDEVILARGDKIIVRTNVDADWQAARFSAHFYNTPAEIEFLVTAMLRIAKDQPQQ
jgi:selenocysteine lyase/cysteine desulfurase